MAKPSSSSRGRTLSKYLVYSFAACLVGGIAGDAIGLGILLERIAPLWRRLSFLTKVSARNLFRYKKRFLMTVFGIAGCTALMICGLGIRDTAISLKARRSCAPRAPSTLCWRRASTP